MKSEDLEKQISELVPLICERLELTTVAAKEFVRLSLKDSKLFDNKQHDYGSHNISDFGFVGVIIRMNDKFQRIKHLAKGNKKVRVKEKLTDNLTDISNYAKIARMLDDGKWPEE